MINKILCFIGIHNWKYTDAEYENDLTEKLAISTKPATRICVSCFKYQERDDHLLGLNSREVVISWHTIKTNNLINK